MLGGHIPSLSPSSPPLPFLSFHFPPPLRSRTPFIAAKGSGERVWAEPGAKCILVHFRHKCAPIRVPKLRRMSRILGTLHSRCDEFVD